MKKGIVTIKPSDGQKNTMILKDENGNVIAQTDYLPRYPKSRAKAWEYLEEAARKENVEMPSDN